MRYSRSGRFADRPTHHSGQRLVSMLVMLVVLGLIYNRAKDPKTWRWFADDSETQLAQVDVKGKADAGKLEKPWTETIVEGPFDTDAEEMEEARKEWEAISDRTPLDGTEMAAYWRFFKWSRAQSFADLERRSQRDTAFTQLWEVPEKFRGKPMRLRMHIKRILSWDAPENTVGVTKVYEAWAWTDESKSFPYVVVFSELPPGMKVGTDISFEGVFVGYFLKNMSYHAFDVRRAAPLLVGRMKNVSRPPPAAINGGDRVIWNWLIAGVVLGAIGIGVWLRFGRRRRVSVDAALRPVDEEEMTHWLTEQAQSSEEQTPVSVRPPET